MTPTLLGRWQTRFFLLGTLGLVITAILWFKYANLGQPAPLFQVLGYLALFGLGWDVLYDYFQQFRWDRDWPAIFQLAAGVWEGLFIFALIRVVGLPGIGREISLSVFLWHYGLVWAAAFLSSQSLMRILFPHWRFRGGQWWGKF